MLLNYYSITLGLFFFIAAHFSCLNECAWLQCEWECAWLCARGEKSHPCLSRDVLFWMYCTHFCIWQCTKITKKLHSCTNTEYRQCKGHSSNSSIVYSNRIAHFVEINITDHYYAEQIWWRGLTTNFSDIMRVILSASFPQWVLSTIHIKSRKISCRITNSSMPLA